MKFEIHGVFLFAFFFLCLLFFFFFLLVFFFLPLLSWFCCFCVSSAVTAPRAHVLQVVLLAAFGRVLGEVDTVEESVVQHCLHIIERLLQSYRGLWPKQRLPVHAALNTLLSALKPKQAVLQSMLPRLVSVVLTHTLKPAEDVFIAGVAWFFVCCSRSEFDWFVDIAFQWFKVGLLPGNSVLVRFTAYLTDMFAQCHSVGECWRSEIG